MKRGHGSTPMKYPAWMEDRLDLHYRIYGENVGSVELRRIFHDSQVKESTQAAQAS